MPHKPSPKREGERRGLTTGEKILVFIGALTLVAAALVVPEFRKMIGLKEEHPPVVVNIPQVPENVQDKKDPPAPRVETIDPIYTPIPMPEKKVHRNNVLRAAKQDEPFSRAAEFGSKYHSAIKLENNTDHEDRNEFLDPTEAEKLIDRRVEPQYPPSAKANARVIIVLWVDAEGNVEKTEPMIGAPDLSDAVQTAVKQWKFKPRIREGKTIPTWHTGIEFRVPGKARAETQK